MTYWREEPYEVDAVVDGSWGSWAIEIKTGSIKTTDLRGLLEFNRRHPSYRPLVVCDSRSLTMADRAGVEATTWQDFLLSSTPEDATRRARARISGSA